jgi:hypothetical protein
MHIPVLIQKVLLSLVDVLVENHLVNLYELSGTEVKQENEMGFVRLAIL